MNRNSSLFSVAPNGKCITQRENVVKNTITVSTHCPGEPAQGRAGSWLGITFSFPCWSSSEEVWWDFKTFSPFSLSFAFFHSKVIPVFTYTISYRPCKHPSSVNISSSNPCTTAWLTYCKFLLPITKTKKREVNFSWFWLWPVLFWVSIPSVQQQLFQTGMLQFFKLQINYYIIQKSFWAMCSLPQPVTHFYGTYTLLQPCFSKIKKSLL